MFPRVKNIIGLDYSPHLIQICKRNLKKISALNVELICGDAADIELDCDCEVFIFYLYYPFDSKILDKILNKISNKRVVIIYNNPMHKGALIDKGLTSFDKGLASKYKFRNLF